MSFTKITAAGIGTTESVTLDGLSVINNGSFGGNLTVGGVLTYEDVTNVDSVGLITARNGIVVGSGITLSKDGDGFFTGVTTATTFVGALTGNVTGNVTGTASANAVLTGSTNDTLVTVTGSNAIQGEANLTFDGSKLTVSSTLPEIFLTDTNTSNARGRLNANGGGLLLGADNDNAAADSVISFAVDGSEKARIDTSGRLLIGTTTEGEGDADDLTIATSGNTGITLRSGTSHDGAIFFSDGTSGTDEYKGTIQYLHSSDAFIFKTDASERVRIHSGGQVQIAGDSTASISSFADDLIIGESGSTAINGITLCSTDSSGIRFHDTADMGEIEFDHSDNSLAIKANQILKFRTNNAERFRINSGGDLLLGTTSDASLANFGSGTGGILIDNVGSSNSAVGVSHDTCELFFGADSSAGYIWQDSDHELFIGTNSTRRVIITAGGQMGLGEVTETAIRNNGAGNKTYLVISKGSGTSAPTTYNADEEYLHIGGREYGSSNNGHYYMGFGYTNGVAGDHSPCAIGMQETTTSNYTKGNFTIRTRSGTAQNSTNADRLTVQSNGNVTTIVGGFSDRTQAGFTARKDDSVAITRLNGSPLEVNRQSNDGSLIIFYQGNSSEGSISVTGSSVNYNGGVITRWSQLKGISTTDKSARPTIYQGTVMSNLDELCSWEHAAVLYTEEEKEDGLIPEGKDVGDIKHDAYTEDNQQLNMTKVSDTETDKDVAGVFWGWDDDDDEIVNDFYVAMTGDMVIRVAASTTVARGDLLVSAGDGTAKPQADDIIRSSTIAKIISTNHTATYPDGSKAYPCVLMAC